MPHGTRAQVQLLLPPSWREELRDAAFPVLVEVLVYHNFICFQLIYLLLSLNTGMQGQDHRRYPKNFESIGAHICPVEMM